MRGPKDEVLRAGAVVRGSLADAYGYLGTVVLLSLVWFAWLACAVLTVGLFTRSLAVMVPVVVVAAAPPAGAAFHVACLVLGGHDVAPRDFVDGLRKFALRSLGVTAAHAGLLAVVAADAAWFLARPGTVAKVVGGLWFYALLFLAMMALYCFPIMVQQDVGTRKVLKRAALLVLADPFYSLVVLVFLAAVTVVCVLFAPAFGLLYMGVTAFACSRAARTLLEEYGAVSGEGLCYGPGGAGRDAPGPGGTAAVPPGEGSSE